jgi:hypothetical protein
LRMMVSLMCIFKYNFMVGDAICKGEGREGALRVFFMALRPQHSLLDSGLCSLHSVI